MPTRGSFSSTTGPAFAGWARQPGLRTVQGELERALGDRLAAARRCTLTVAGRTDRGVHAWGQVASLRGPAGAAAALNALLPPDVAVLACAAAAPTASTRAGTPDAAPTATACSRASAERLERERGRCCWPRAPGWTVAARLRGAAAGTHDFTAFTPTETDARALRARRLDARWVAATATSLEFWIEADTFMRHMNRVLVGTMLEVAGGRRPLEDFAGCSTAPTRRGGPDGAAARAVPARRALRRRTAR